MLDLDLGNLASKKQKQAANPESSIWVNASAGTGKTKVLTDRVLNLLLKGSDPSKILCLTFTRAAAAEMQGRIYDTLSKWASMPKDDLLDSIKALGYQITATDDNSANEVIFRARGLFNKIINMSEGLKIYTIHAFCQSILAKFPVEADIVPGSKIADEVALSNILKKSIERAIGDNRSKHSLEAIASKMSFDTFLEVLQSLQSNEVLETLASNDLIDKIKSAILSSFPSGLADISSIDNKDNYKDNYNYNDHLSLEDNKKRLINKYLLDGLDLRKEILKQMATSIDKWGSNNNKAILPKMSKILKTINDIESKALQAEAIIDIFTDYQSIFLTQSGGIRKSLFVKKVMESLGDKSQQLIAREAEGLHSLNNQIKAFDNYNLSKSIIEFCKVVLDYYEQEKRFHGVLDYNDLIIKTTKLLNKSDISSWVLYKLDGGLEHMLVDEAQDTSPSQWEVIKAIATEFFHDNPEQITEKGQRTLFVVGDEKQSIYSFQGADPVKFNQMKQHFASKSLAYKKNYMDIDLDTSFRSTKAILGIVDKIFNNESIKSRVCIMDEMPTQINKKNLIHKSYRQQDYGRIELWPLLLKDDNQEGKNENGEDSENDIALELQEAQRIAKQIKYWLDNREILESKQRPIRPEDIMILVKRRTIFIDYLIRQLHKYNIPVAGRDRMVLDGEIVIKDLIALGKFLIFPEDDFSLACVLKSPIFNLDEESLFKLCYERNSKNLFERIKELSTTNKDYQLIYEQLKAMLAMVDYKTPFELYGKILGDLDFGNIEANFIKRLGAIAKEQIDEFLNILLSFESENPPSLELFLNWFVGQSLEVKRDFEKVKAIRIMTVHGSKGLQAPIVFMPDTTRAPTFKAKIMKVYDKAQACDLLLYNCPESESSNNLLRYKRLMNEQSYNESLRLLYVAMTRAEDILIVSGYLSKGKKASDNCWYHHIASHLSGDNKAINPATSEQILFQESGHRLEKASCDNRDAFPSYQINDNDQDNNSLGRNTTEQGSTKKPSWLFSKSQQLCINREIEVINPSVYQSSKDFSSDDDHYITNANDNFGEKGKNQSQDKLTPEKTIEKTIERGIIIHKLLELLPETAKENWQNIINHQCRKSKIGFSQEELTDITNKVINTINNFPEIFKENDDQITILKEQPFVDHKEGNKVIKGIIDKVIIDKSNKKIKIIDYKTGAKKPSHHIYRAQLDSYARAMENLFPGYRIEKFILWIDQSEMEEF